MLASEFVKEIQEAIEKHGDMRLEFHDKGFGTNYSNCSVNVEPPNAIVNIGTIKVDVWC